MDEELHCGESALGDQMRKSLTVVAALASTVLLSSAANAAVQISIQEVGSDVVATTSGSLNLAGLNYVSTGSNTAFLEPSLGYFFSRAASYDIYTTLMGPTGFGTSVTTSGTGTGDAFAISKIFGGVGVPAGYSSGSPLSGITTSVGATPGSYVFTVPNDTITVQVGSLQAVSAVPEPSTWAMMLLGFGVVGGAIRVVKRRQKLSTRHA